MGILGVDSNQAPATLEALLPGAIIADKYRIDRVIGEGGMGIVVAATHIQLEQQVAIKVLRKALVSDDGLLDRFFREARATVKIRGEHVGRVHDVGAMADGTPYIVMEHLDGNDLAATLFARTKLGTAEAVDYVLQACEAIAEAHALGIVHRDIKPENLFLARRIDGTTSIKVLDFGISKELGANHRKTSVTTPYLGTPAYMSPEQLTAPSEVDTRTDLWSLGVTLYELVTGIRPFTATNFPALYSAILSRDPPPLGAHLEGVPRGLDAVVQRCLAKDVADRYPTVEALVRDLARFRLEERPSKVSSLDETLREAGSPVESSLPPPPPSHQSLLVPFLIGAGLCFMFALVAFAVHAGLEQTPTAAAASSSPPALTAVPMNMTPEPLVASVVVVEEPPPSSAPPTPVVRKPPPAPSHRPVEPALPPPPDDRK